MSRRFPRPGRRGVDDRGRPNQGRPDGPDPVIDVPDVPDGVLQVCHPDWRGVRSSALAFEDPVLEADDLSRLVPSIAAITGKSVETVVIQGWPPGAASFARAASAAGLDVLAVSHSAPTQHGVDAGEAEALSEVLDLIDEGVVARLGVVKAGLAESLRALGHPVEHVPNRVPDIDRPAGDPGGTPDGTPVGIFLFPMWRKNVATQVLAAAELGWTPHLMGDPGIGYLATVKTVVHGELERDAFLAAFSSMHMNFNVTLSECHPMMPMESYRLGVPCLLSRTSDLFSEDPEFRDLTTVADADDPHAIALAARRLDDDRTDAVRVANQLLDAADRRAAKVWNQFTRRFPAI